MKSEKVISTQRKKEKKQRLYLIIVSKIKSSGASNLDLPKGSLKVFLLNEKGKIAKIYD